MASDKQIEANRRNAMRSTGPRSPEGKDAVRLNALKHGLRVEAFDIVPGEDPEEFAARLDGLAREYLPGTETEARLVRRAAILSWKLDRADRHESALLSRRIHDAMNACATDDEDTRAEAAAIASFDPSGEGEQVRRYQSSIGRELLRTFEVLNKMRRENMKRLKEMEVEVSEANRANSPAPIKPNLEEARRQSQPHTSRESTVTSDKPFSRHPAAPNKPISPPDMQPSVASDEVRSAESEQAPAPFRGNRAERRRRQRLERQFALARRAGQSHSGR